jgi:type I site-specific restriction endonuclease
VEQAHVVGEKHSRRNEMTIDRQEVERVVASLRQTARVWKSFYERCEPRTGAAHLTKSLAFAEAADFVEHELLTSVEVSADGKAE